MLKDFINLKKSMALVLNCIVFITVFLTLCVNSVSSETLNYEGDITVLGLFEVFKSDKGECGSAVVTSSVMAAEAVKWYLSQLNDAGDTRLKIGLKGYQTCRIGIQAVQDVIDNVREPCNGTAAPPIIGVIGPEYSSEVEAVAPILNSFEEEAKLLMLGFSTTSEMLWDKFPNFFRVVPNDRLQIDMMVQSMTIMEWNRIAIIYEKDVYGERAQQMLMEKAKENDICIAYTASIDIQNGINSQEVENISRSMLITSNPPMNGFVFFGTELTANVLLQKMNSLRLENIPIGFYSDGISLDVRAFSSVGSTIRKAKGSLIASPTFRQINEFQDHWKGILTDSDKYTLESATNPWLKDVYADFRSCDRDSCVFTPLSDEEFDAQFGDQQLYIQYAIMSAHAMAKVLNSVHAGYCPSGAGGSCDFVNSFRPGDMIERAKDVRVNFDTDFSIRLQSLSGLTMEFDDKREPKFGDQAPTYQLFNFRHAGLTEGPVVFAKVGDFTNGHMTLNASNVIDYPDDVTPRFWPIGVRRGDCSPDWLCAGCIPDDLPFSYLHDPGDLYIVGLVPVYDKSGTQACGEIRPYHGYQLAESVRFAVKKFNDPTSFFARFNPGLKIGVIVLNTCNNPAVIQRIILNLHKNGLRLANGDVISMENRILGYAGPLGSTVSIGVSGVLNKLQKVSISYASTNPTLSDRNAYKYFMRVVSPDNEQANAMVKVIKELDVDYIQVLYSEGAYGEGGYEALKSVMRDNKVCIKQAIMVPESDSYYGYYDNIRRYPHAKVVVLFLRSHVTVPFVETLTREMEKEGDFIFIGSEAWGRNNEILQQDVKRMLRGSFSMVVEMAQDSELLAHVQKITPQPFSVNPWSMQYLQAKWQCFYETSYNKKYPRSCADFSSSTVLDGWSTSAYFSALALLMGSSSFYKSMCGTTSTTLCADYLNNPAGLVEAIETNAKLDIYGNGIRQRVFTDNGDGNVGYAIYNIQQEQGIQQQNLRYLKVGQYPLVGEFTFDKGLLDTASKAIRSRCPNDQACAGCIETEVTNGPGQSDEEGQSGVIIALVVLLIIAVIIAVVLAVLLRKSWMKHKRDKSVYLTPTEDVRRSTDYMHFERPAVLGSNDQVEECMEMPHPHPHYSDSSLKPEVIPQTDM